MRTRLRLVAAFGCAAAITGCTGSGRIFETREIRIVDAEGRTAIVFDSDDYGGRVRVFSASGNETALIEVNEYGGAVYTFGEDHIVRTFTGAWEGGGLVDARTPSGYSGARLLSGDFGGAVFTFDYEGELSAAMTPQENGGMLELYQTTENREDSGSDAGAGDDDDGENDRSVSRLVMGFSEEYGYLQVVNASDLILVEVTANDHGGVVMARSREGAERSRLSCVDDAGQIIVFNHNGDPVASLLVHNDSGALQIRDVEGFTGVELMAESQTGLVRTLRAGKLSTLATSTVHGGAFIAFDAETNERTAIMGTTELGGSIEALTIDGTLVGRLMAAKEGGALIINDNERQLRGGIVVSSGDGVVESYNADGRLSGQLGRRNTEVNPDAAPRNGEASEDTSMPAVRERPPY